MLVCPKCGAYYADGITAFCLVHGTPLIAVDPGTPEWSEGNRQVEAQEKANQSLKRRLKWRRVLAGSTIVLIAALIVYGAFSLETTPVANTNVTTGFADNVDSNVNVAVVNANSKTNVRVDDDANVNANTHVSTNSHHNANTNVDVHANLNINVNANVEAECTAADKELAIQAIKDKFLGFTLENSAFDRCTTTSIVVTCKWRERSPALPAKVKCEKRGRHWQCF